MPEGELIRIPGIPGVLNRAYLVPCLRCGGAAFRVSTVYRKDWARIRCVRCCEPERGEVELGSLDVVRRVYTPLKRPNRPAA